MDLSNRNIGYGITGSFLYIRKNQERDSETDGDGSTCDSHLFLSDAELRYAVWNGKRVYGRSL